MGLDGSIAGLIHGGHTGAVELARVALDVAFQGHWPHTWLEVEQPLQTMKVSGLARTCLSGRAGFCISSLRKVCWPVHFQTSADQLFGKAPSLARTLCATHWLVDTQPVCKVSSIRQSCGEAQEANGQVCLRTNVAHAGHNHLQNGPPAAATAPMTVIQKCHPTSKGFVSDSSSPMLLLLSYALWMSAPAP